LSKSGGSSTASHSRNAKATGLPRPGWLTVLLLIVIYGGLLFDPLLRPVLLFALIGVGLIFAMAMALGMMGTGLFAVGDRLFAWLRRCTRWPGD
jgi:pilus assembly protein TadC